MHCQLLTKFDATKLFAFMITYDLFHVLFRPDLKCGTINAGALKS